MKQAVKRLVAATGYEIRRRQPPLAPPQAAAPPSFDLHFDGLWNQCAPFTMTGVSRGRALYEAVRHLIRNKVQGDFIECGVWRGGSAMLMAHSVMSVGGFREIHLYDTFTGMSEPTSPDAHGATGVSAAVLLEANQGNIRCEATQAEVEANMRSTGYPMDLVRLIPGKVEDTLPKADHGDVALLRLDTDWYESTKLELELLYPRLVSGGILIVDDYGHWQGARRAVDEYFRGSQFLCPLDYTGRLLVKY
jgi:O-methyltransferase